MSEPAPEVPRPRGPKPPAQSKGNGLGKKVGPLPVWAWGAIIIGTIGFILFVRSKSGKASSATTGSGEDLSGIHDFGGGPPAAPANGVVPPGYNWTDPCPPGFTLVSGACVPTSGPITGPPITTIPVPPPSGPPSPYPHPIIGPPVPVMRESGAGIVAAHEALHTAAASTAHAPVKRLRKH